MEGEIFEVIRVWMEGELSNFIKVWAAVFTALSYCYFAGKFVPKGLPRLLIVFPVLCLFLNLPLHLHTMHLGGMTAFFIAWLANFKLLMFAFDIGPLSDPSISLPRFLFLACFPIKIQQNPKNPSHKKSKKGQQSLLSYAIKTLLVGVIVRAYEYTDQIGPILIQIIYCFHIYFGIEIILAMVAAMARALLGLELEPQFNEPYLSTSLQDFWGRRWNIMVTSILRPIVYEPVLSLSALFTRRQWAPLPAVFATFVVSAVMHELIFYYLGRVVPTFEITWFFLLHGVCLVVEIAIKKAVNGRWRVPQYLSGPLTVGFVMSTGMWLFFPQLIRCRGVDRALAEYAAFGAFVKDVGGALRFKPLNATTVA
ncbi:hypothetical protein RJ639_030908 [Escallonia herrerae]|uniref:Wax synthase domain-containing protein n=1 Tax=Escallonia herrerae TaxID=1293975 RepID=A0AA89BDK5_9ASTE|nr:hypothetical protein RJ639_030908 [Escallonia herrerae]